MQVPRHTHGGTDAPECTTCATQQSCANCSHRLGSHNAFGHCLDMVAESPAISRSCTCSGFKPMPIDDGFDWPCDRHEAHGPHDDVDGSQMSEKMYLVAVARPSSDFTCPGVGAHPNTMIGRNDVLRRSDE